MTASLTTTPLMWVVYWTTRNSLGRMTMKREDFLRREDAQTFFDERLAESKRMNPEHEAVVSLKRAPFADRLEGWLKALRSEGFRARKNVSYSAMSKMKLDAPTVFHTGYQGYAYEAWGDEVYRKSSNEAVQILHFNHDNLSPAHYQMMRYLLDAYSLPYAWDGTDHENIQIITPHGELVFHVCDFCEGLAQSAYSVDVDGHRMCKTCVEASE